jgi:RHS repeat-associated protein
MPVSLDSPTFPRYLTGVDSTIDYYPFGQEMPERYFARGKYRFGFNGKQYDNDIADSTCWQDYGMRENDVRIGRFISVDPITKKYPELTPYQFATNRPIDGIDLDGREWQIAIPAAVASTEAGLIALGIITSGVILQKTHSGGLELTPGAKKGINMFGTNQSTFYAYCAISAYANFYKNYKDNPGWAERKKRESKAKEAPGNTQIIHDKMLDETLSNPNELGDNSPIKSPNSNLGKVVAIISGTAVAWWNYKDNTDPKNENNSTSNTNRPKANKTNNNESGITNNNLSPNSNNSNSNYDGKEVIDEIFNSTENKK